MMVFFAFVNDVGIFLDDFAVSTSFEFILSRWICRCWARSVHSVDGIQYDGSLRLVESGIFSDKVRSFKWIVL